MKAQTRPVLEATLRKLGALTCRMKYSFGTRGCAVSVIVRILW